MKLLEFIARLTYNIDGLSPALKLYLNQFLTFHFSKSLSLDVIQNIENKKASNGFRGREEIIEASSVLSEEERAWCVAVVKLLKKQAEESGDRMLSIRIDRFAADLASTLELIHHPELIDSQLARIEQELEEYRGRKVIRIPSRIWPLVLDFFLRVSVLIAFGLTGSDLSLLPAINLTPIVVVVLGITYLASRRDRKYNTRLLESYGGASNFRIQFVLTARQYTWLAMFLAIGVFVSYLLPDQLYLLALFGLTIYYFINLRFFRVGRIDENDLVRQVEHNPGRQRGYDVDRNDEEIVQLETKLGSLTSRLDAYVLESALFGALTFSGFLQIMASDLVSFTDLENFSHYIFNTSKAAIYFDSEAFYTGMTDLSNKVSLLCLVSVESLICSGFFLAVIASRLRFSDVADRVNASLNVAKTYNAKEEVLFAEHEEIEKRPGRLVELNRKISEQINLASEALEKVNPVMAYMRYFRNAGITVFLVILISSTLFITGVLGWTFIAVVAATYVYFNYSRINISIRATYLDLRIKFIRRAALFLAISFVPILLSMFISGTAYWKLGEVLLGLGYAAVALYVFTWLLLAAHVDESFGDIEPTDRVMVRAGRWEFLKNIVAFLILLYGIGLAFKELGLRGADEMVMLTSTILTLLSYFIGYYLSKIRWLGVIGGTLLAISVTGIMFKILHLPGADEMLRIAFFGLIVITPVLIIKRKVFHRLFFRFMTSMAVVVLLVVSGFFFGLQVVTSHRTFNAGPITDVLSANLARRLIKDPSMMPDAIKKSDWYIQTWGTTPGYSLIYRGLVRNYNFMSEYVLESDSVYGKVDSTTINNALIAARQGDKIRQLFKYDPTLFSPNDLMTESEILLKLGKRDQALESLNLVLKKASSPDFQAALNDRIKEIKGDSASISL